MLDAALDEMQAVPAGPVWRAVPPEVKSALTDEPVPWQGRPLADVFAEYRALIEPYTVGNRHPRFFGWVHGQGTPSGMLAQMLTASLNINAGGREHAGAYVERAVVAWWARVFGFPEGSSGIVTSGTSMATLLAVLVARTQTLGVEVRGRGLGDARLAGYAAVSAHHCLHKAFDAAGLGHAAIRRIPVDGDGRMRVDALQQALAHDRERGIRPFFLYATAGSVNTGAVDDLARLADLAAQEALWFHIDGAFGALAMLAPARRGLLQGLERADSLALDFHKWLHVPYGSGLMLTRHASVHRATFADEVHYLARLREGTAGGDPWFCDFGLELSRGFGALGVWFAMREFGLERLGEAIEHDCLMAEALGTRLERIPEIRLAAPVRLNIVCARYAAPGLSAEELDERNAAIVVELQTTGVAVPSTTRIGGNLVMRFNFTNHRVRPNDLEITAAAIEAAIGRFREGPGGTSV